MKTRNVELNTMKRIYTSDELIKMTSEIYNNKTNSINGDVKERIQKYESYLLERLHISEVEGAMYYVDEDLVDEYCGMKSENVSPTILDVEINGKRSIIEGEYRMKVYIDKGEAYIFAYIPILY